MKCKECGLKFESKEALEEHVKVVHGNPFIPERHIPGYVKPKVRILNVMINNKEVKILVKNGIGYILEK